MTLFDQRFEDETTEFARLRDEDDSFHVEQRAYIDGLWSSARPYLDSQFKVEFARRTAQRFWELRLASTLLMLGFVLDAPSAGRPDFGTALPNGRRLWIEAVAPTSGELGNPDRVLDPIPDGRFRKVPQEQILLRYTQALHSKNAAFATYREQGIVGKGDHCVIGLSTSGLRYSDREHPPRIMGALLPVGEQIVRVDLHGVEAEEVRYSFRDSVSRVNGKSIGTSLFFSEAYNPISAILLDSARPTAWRQQSLALFKTIHNPFAAMPLPAGCFPLGMEYMVTSQGNEEYELTWTTHLHDGSLSG